MKTYLRRSLCLAFQEWLWTFPSHGGPGWHRLLQPQLEEQARSAGTAGRQGTFHPRFMQGSSGTRPGTAKASQDSSNGFWQARAPALRVERGHSRPDCRQQPSPAARLAGAGSALVLSRPRVSFCLFAFKSGFFVLRVKEAKGLVGLLSWGFFQDELRYPFLSLNFSWYSLNEEWGHPTRTKRLGQHAKTAITAKWKK